MRNKKPHIKTFKKLKLKVEVGIISLVDSLPCQRLRLPQVASDSFGFSKAAGCTAFLAYMVGASAATSALDVHNFALALAH